MFPQGCSDALNIPETGNGMPDILNEARYELEWLLLWHYALGMNALNTCFVTGYGERRILHTHHRPSVADGGDAPVPGLISGGPNKRFPYPCTREKLGDDIPPARCFLDETPSAYTSEIAICWNVPVHLYRRVCLHAFQRIVKVNSSTKTALLPYWMLLFLQKQHMSVCPLFQYREIPWYDQHPSSAFSLQKGLPPAFLPAFLP